VLISTRWDRPETLAHETSEVKEMEMLRKLEPLALFFVIVGALNWGILAVTDTNVVAEIFGTGTVSDVLYVLVGLSGLMFVPRLAEAIRFGGPHPRGA
jgi:uncharacterized protein